MGKGSAEISADNVESTLGSVESISWRSRSVPAFTVELPRSAERPLGAVGESRMWFQHVEAVRPDPGLLDADVWMPVMND